MNNGDIHPESRPSSNAAAGGSADFSRRADLHCARDGFGKGQAVFRAYFEKGI